MDRAKLAPVDETIASARSALMPYESWERLNGESSAAFAAFCAYRDLGPERNIRRAAEGFQQDSPEGDDRKSTGRPSQRYGQWRGWASAHKWRERAADYDNYLEKLKQTELRKTIEERGRVHREITGKMLLVVGKKLDSMDPAELAQGTVTDWASMAIRADREAAGLFTGKEKADGQTDKNGQITFIPEFEGL